jgi:hypothetical protein
VPGSSRRSAVLLASAAALPAAVIAGLVALWLGGGFSPPPHRPATGPVTVIAPSPQPRCSALIAALPRVVDGAKARPVPRAAESSAAWGDPPIVLRCGVPSPSYAPTAQLLGIEGVTWATAKVSGAVVWRSTDLDVPVEITVPDPYRDKAATQILNPLATPLKSTLR